MARHVCMHQETCTAQGSKKKVPNSRPAWTAQALVLSSVQILPVSAPGRNLRLVSMNYEYIDAGEPQASQP
eukprot:scaffold34075_cov18-Prasinocladus_malaysianus.AAC.1